MYNVYMDNNKWFNNKWWVEKLECLFPERISYPDIHDMPFCEIIKFMWFKSQDRVLGYRYREGRRPEFVYLLTSKWFMVKKDFCLEKTSEDMCAIEALADSSKLPLCIGLDWFSPFLEKLLR